MKLLFINIISIVLISLFFFSCKTDIDINGKKKETLVVYSILDATKKTQFIKINRAFLGEGNTLEYAQIRDSSIVLNKLLVKLLVFNPNTNTIIKTYNITDTAMIFKQSDVFFTGLQPYYKFDLDSVGETKNKKPVFLNKNYTYKLIIENVEHGFICESEIGGISSITELKEPKVFSQFALPPIGFTSDRGSIKFGSAYNGKRYEMKYIFYYVEADKNDPTKKSEKLVEWVIGSVNSSNKNGDENLEYTYTPNDFYYIISQKIPYNPNVKRIAKKVELKIAIGDENLSTYTDVTKPSNTIIQERPLYSNITNGVGLFACKSLYSQDFELNLRSKDSLLNGQYTKNLNFVNTFAP